MYGYLTRKKNLNYACNVVALEGILYRVCSGHTTTSDCPSWPLTT